MSDLITVKDFAKYIGKSENAVFIKIRDRKIKNFSVKTRINGVARAPRLYKFEDLKKAFMKDKRTTDGKRKDDDKTINPYNDANAKRQFKIERNLSAQKLIISGLSIYG